MLYSGKNRFRQKLKKKLLVCVQQGYVPHNANIVTHFKCVTHRCTFCTNELMINVKGSETAATTRGW